MRGSSPTHIETLFTLKVSRGKAIKRSTIEVLSCNAVLLQFTSKQMERAAKKCEKDQKAEQAKIKKAGFKATSANITRTAPPAPTDTHLSRPWYKGTSKVPKYMPKMRFARRTRG